MRASRRAGVSGYLETFILIGLAIGGSGIVLGAATGYSSSLQGASVAIDGARISQGSRIAFEKLTVSNTGQAPITSFAVSTLMAPTSASYCYTLANPVTLGTLSTTCPAMATNPRTLTVAYSIPPGGALTVTLQLTGGAFAVGSASQVIVTTSAGASATVEVRVLPA